MSTSALIGIERDNMNIAYIKLQSDGDPDHAGRILLENYRTKGQVERLMKLGELSRLGRSPEDMPADVKARVESAVEDRSLSPEERASLQDEYCFPYGTNGMKARTVSRRRFSDVEDVYNYVWGADAGWRVKFWRHGWVDLTPSVIEDWKAGE